MSDRDAEASVDFGCANAVRTLYARCKKSDSETRIDPLCCKALLRLPGQSLRLSQPGY